ncbi:MAG: PPC domain-containing protein, partial [Rhodospirillales bacterium]|nr:PPC domain-containing protein [Rhodospirillales bacterium]
MNRGLTQKLLVLAGLAGAVALAPVPAFAAEPSLTVNGSGGGISSGTQSLLNQARSAAQGATAGTGSTMYVDPASPVSAMPGYGALSAADQAFAQSMAYGYQLYKAMGGTNLDRQAVIQRKDGMFYVGLDGEGGRWFASPEQALSFLFNSLVAKDDKISSGTKKAVITCAQDILCAVLAMADELYKTIATVARGSTVDVTITGSGFSNVGGAPVVASGDGIVTLGVTYVSSEKLGAKLQVLPTATLGENMVGVFNAGKSYQNVGAYKIVVTDGGTAAAAAATESATKATATALATPATVTGKLLAGSAEQFYKITVNSAGTLTLASTGGVDVKGTLEDANGQVLATNEDGGTWYNFKLSRAVTPGTYYLRVGHCCGGTGAYQITS